MSDLIRRKDAQKLVLNRNYDLANETQRMLMYNAVSNIPSAEPERKKGKWIKEDLSGYLTPGGNSIYHCSECGHTEGPYPHPRLTDFCPDCGADMRGE